jgi:3-oxoadipate enol-lactonase
MTEDIAKIVQPAHQRTQQEWEQVQDVAGIAYRSEGTGVPVLFLHGIGGAARQFQSQLSHFGQGHRALAWDAPGYGESEPLPLVTIDALAGALGMFIRALGLERPVIVGHSLGGMIALRLLAEAPHVARGLVLSQTAAAFGGKDPAWGQRFVHDRLAPLDAGHSMADLAPGMVAAMVGPGADPSGIALAEDCIAHTPDSTYRDTVLAMPGFDQRAALPAIVVPVLALAGSVDTSAPPEGMQRMAERIPGARFEVLDGVGHLAHLEQPKRFNAVLGDFLSALPR